MPSINAFRERAAFPGRSVARRPAHPAIVRPKKTLQIKAAHPACLRFSAGCLRCAGRKADLPTRCAALRSDACRPFVRQPLRTAAHAERGPDATRLALPRRWVRAGQVSPPFKSLAGRREAWR